MVSPYTIVATERFKSEFRKMKHGTMRDKIRKQIAKIIGNPDVGKPLRYDLKGERALYVKPYRMTYRIEGDKIILLKIRHRKEVYK